MKRLFSTILLLSLFFMFTVPTAATEITPYYDGVTSGAALLSISNLGVASCTATFDLRYSLVEADIEMQLFRFEASGWKEVKTWEEHFGPSSKRTLIMDKLYAVSENGIYMVRVIADIETSAGADHLEPTSNRVEYY